jgi:LemA protein
MYYATCLTIILIVAYTIWHFTAFNALTNATLATRQSWSNVEVELKRRLDLILNLVEVVKGYAKHEADTLVETISARSYQDPSSAKLATSNAMHAVSGIMAIVENYPEIKANTQFLTLQAELVNTENRIATARKIYNQNVNLTHNLCLGVPSNIIAWVYEIKPAQYFDIPDSEANAIIKLDLQINNHE